MNEQSASPQVGEHALGAPDAEVDALLCGEALELRDRAQQAPDDRPLALEHLFGEIGEQRTVRSP